MSADHPEQTDETSELTPDISSSHPNTPEIVNESIHTEIYPSAESDEFEQTQASPETPLPEPLPPLPDMEETIGISPRVQRILLYLTSRARRHAATPAPELALTEITPTEPDVQDIVLEEVTVPTELADISSEVAPLAPAALVSTEPDVQDTELEEATIPIELADISSEVAPLISTTPAFTEEDEQDTAPELAAILDGLANIPTAELALLPPLPPMEPLWPRSIERNLPEPWFSRKRSVTLLTPQRRKRIARLQHFSRKHLRRARANDQRASRNLWTNIWITLATFFLIFLAIGSIVGYYAYTYIGTTEGTYASQVLTLRDLLPPDNLKIYDSQGTLIDQLTDQGAHTTVQYNQIASSLVDATVSIEDHTFWQNQGFDLTGILRAALADAQNTGQLQGGSTITQQLIKKLIVGDSSDITRKLSELILAPQINGHYTKQDIMEMYLNTIYYGEQAYGIDAAATAYFGLEDKPGHSAASQLDLAQSILLAGLPRNAALYNPFEHPQTSNKRFHEVLTAMIEQGYITQIQAQDAYQEYLSPTFFKSSPTLQDQAPHFDDYVLSQLEDSFHLKRSQLSRSGLIVTTTLNLALQQEILPIMQQHIAALPTYHNLHNAAEVLIDFHTGAIISMLGSIDYYNKAIDGQFNVALGYRQPGSSFKPYVYVTAFSQGISPAQAIDDVQTNFSNPGGTPNPYSPENYDHRLHGHMTLRCALQNSLNIPAVSVLYHVGVNNALQTAKAMGINPDPRSVPGLSMVLGGMGVRLLDHTSAYGVFANGGVRQPYYSISKVVQGTTGKVLFQHQLGPGIQVLTPQLSYMMTSVLSDNASRIADFGDCNVLQLYSNSQSDCYRGNRGTVRPAAVKTGTTQDFHDNLTMGYTTDYVMGVWAGNDDGSAMNNITGLTGAAPIWHDAMLAVEQGHPVTDFQNPGGLTRATVTYPDGVTSTDWFLPGTVPTFNLNPTPTPDGNGNGLPPTNALPVAATGSVPAPLCSTYSFAFAPPSDRGNWW